MELQNSKLGSVKVRRGSLINLDDLREYLRLGGRVERFAEANQVGPQKIYHLCRDYGIQTVVWLPEPLAVENQTWVAACIDCEGMITAHAVPGHDRVGRSVAIYARVQMTCQLVPQRLHELCKGNLSGPKPGKRNGEKSLYHWQLGPNGLRWLLPQIMPYLLTKKRRAEVVLEILSNNRQGKSMPAESLVPLLEEIRRLNARGGEVYAPLHQLRAGDKVVVNDFVSCACGCGQSFQRFNRWGRERKFVFGHASSLGRTE